MARQEAATMQKECCDRTSSSCDLLCTLCEPKGGRGAHGFVLEVHPRLYNVSVKL